MAVIFILYTFDKKVNITVIKKIKEKYKYPLNNPTLKNVYFGHKIKHIKENINYNLLYKHTGDHVKLIIEIGSGLGRTTKFLAQNCRNASIICIDTWDERFGFNKEQIYDFFIGYLFSYRYKIIPINKKLSDFYEFNDIKDDVQLIVINNESRSNTIVNLLNYFKNSVILINDVVDIKIDGYETIVDNGYTKIRKEIHYNELIDFKKVNDTKLYDTNETFIINVYKEHEIMLENCLKSIRKNYRSSNIILINDGGDDKYENLANEYKVLYLYGNNIKKSSYSLLWWHRICYIIDKLRINSRYFIKIDPDVIIFKKLNEYPKFDYSGKYNLIRRAGFEYKEFIQGFFKVLTDRFITFIYDNNFCLDEKYTSYEYRREMTDQISEDKVLFDICLKYEISWGNIENLSMNSIVNESTIAATGINNELLE